MEAWGFEFKTIAFVWVKTCKSDPTKPRMGMGLSELPEQRLLDAAHIISDKNERLGQPIVPNGLPLSKIHHAAFDAHLIGIDPDYRLHVSDRLLDQNDGLMLEALKQIDGEALHLPNRVKDRPDRDRLAIRFERFKEVAGPQVPPARAAASAC